MNYTLDKVTLDKKEILYSLLQFSLYDGSQYIENNLNENAKFQYNGLTIILLMKIEMLIL